MSSREAINNMAVWVAAIADNVKNPIASINSVLDLIDSHVTNPAVIEASIAQVRRRLADLNEYVSELADFARPALIYPTRVAVSTLFENALLSAALPADCVVNVDLTPRLSATIDRSKIVLAVKALLRNAYEAVDATKTPHVRISGKQQADGSLLISVEDNGRGISPEILHRVTEPFFTTKEAGTGLGLAVVKKYVEAHGGRFAISPSELLGGCRIELTLPTILLASEETHQ